VFCTLHHYTHIHDPTCASSNSNLDEEDDVIDEEPGDNSHGSCYDCLPSFSYVSFLFRSLSLIAFFSYSQCTIDLGRFRVSFHIADDPNTSYLLVPVSPYL
jgi:hypothetical protein